MRVSPRQPVSYPSRVLREPRGGVQEVVSSRALRRCTVAGASSLTVDNFAGDLPKGDQT